MPEFIFSARFGMRERQVRGNLYSKTGTYLEFWIFTEGKAGDAGPCRKNPMNKRTLGLVAAAMLGGLSFGVGPSSAAPLAVPGIQAGDAAAIPVQMTRSERMMMRDRMMQRRMMKRRMMERHMMRRQMMKRRMMNRM